MGIFKRGITYQRFAELIFSALLQIGGMIIIGYATSWVVVLGVLCVLWGHNVGKHFKQNSGQH